MTFHYKKPNPDGSKPLESLLLNELQKQYRHAKQQDETIRKLEARLAALEAQLPNATAKAASGEVPSSSGGGH